MKGVNVEVQKHRVGHPVGILKEAAIDAVVPQARLEGHAGLKTILVERAGHDVEEAVVGCVVSDLQGVARPPGTQGGAGGGRVGDVPPSHNPRGEPHRSVEESLREAGVFGVGIHRLRGGLAGAVSHGDRPDVKVEPERCGGQICVRGGGGEAHLRSLTRVHLSAR